MRWAVGSYSTKRWITFLLGLIFLFACGEAETPVETEPLPVTPSPIDLITQAPGNALPTEIQIATEAPVIPEDTATLPPLPAGPTLPRLEPGTPFRLDRVQMIDGLNGWAVAESEGHQHLLRSWDGGLTWRDVSPPQPVADSVPLLVTFSFLNS